LNDALLGQDWRDDAAPETRARIGALIAGCSLESTAHARSIAEACAAPLAQGTSVYITALPGDAPGAVIDAATRLRKAGLEPVPHLGARYFAVAGELDACLTRLVAEAGVRRVLAIGGDIDQPRGGLSSSRDLIATGLLEKHGIARVGLAAYPEGHQRIPGKLLAAELAAKIAALRQRGLAPYVVTQFCFDAAPIEAFVTRFAADFPDVPVHVGLAGPAKVTTLLKYAAACGVGTSLRALSRRVSLGKLLTESGPEPIIGALLRDARVSRQIARLHVFTFGGIQRTAEWAKTFAR
jgi:methylenetetrahydrofolate reductase (NADPH)